MNKSSLFRSSGRGALVAFAVLAPFGLAHARELNLSAIGEHFPDTVSAAPEQDMSRYELLNLSAIGEKIYVSKAGAQGPVREDAATQEQNGRWLAEQRALGRQLWPFGSAYPK